MAGLDSVVGAFFGSRLHMIGKSGGGRWSPSPLLYASAAVHAGAAAVCLARPRLWPWALGAVALNHVILASAGLWPRSQLLGSNWIRLPEAPGAARVAITIDDGPDPEVTPAVLDPTRRAPTPARASFAWAPGSSSTPISPAKSCAADITSKITANGTGTTSRSSVRRRNACRNRPRAGEHRARHRIGQTAVFPRARRIAQSVPGSCAGTAEIDSWRAGPGVGSTRSTAIRMQYFGAWPIRSATEISCCCMTATRRARPRYGKPVILEVLPRLLDVLA